MPSTLSASRPAPGQYFISCHSFHSRHSFYLLCPPHFSRPGRRQKNIYFIYDIPFILFIVSTPLFASRPRQTEFHLFHFLYCSILQLFPTFYLVIAMIPNIYSAKPLFSPAPDLRAGGREICIPFPLLHLCYLLCPSHFSHPGRRQGNINSIHFILFVLLCLAFQFFRESKNCPF